MKPVRFAPFLLCVFVLSAFPSFAEVPADLQLVAVLAVDGLADTADLSPAVDLLSVGLYRSADTGAGYLRVSFLSLSEDVPGQLARAFVASGRPGRFTVQVIDDRTEAVVADATLQRDAGLFRPLADKQESGPMRLSSDPDALYFSVPEAAISAATPTDPWRLTVISAPENGARDSLSASFPADKAYEAHCAFVLHGNQGIGYTDVLHGRPEDLDGSGFDEAMQAHQDNGVPGNFHMSGTLMTSAEWSARNGDPVDFNAWLAAGVTAGWAGMITSAYGQHMMPFVNNEMNDWAVNIQTQMVNTRYGYFPTVAWVPERVWLDTTGYPSSGVNDWIGDNWQAHGVNGVILDDDVHLSGYDNHQIHTLSGNGLRLIPRDRNFTGNIIGGNGQGSLDILTGLAGSGVGEFRIAVFAEDWEAVAEMGGWAGIVPNAKETYDWMIAKCAAESAWLHTWKLADALANPDFSGSTIAVTPGTYNEIGGFDGYGGADNSWYGHWAGFVPYANGGDVNGTCAGGGGNCKNYGTLWNEAYAALLAAPDNNISQAGWYVMMTNLHETAWHDYLGGPISGWQHKYSAHIKNAMIYAEAAHWANGEYATTTNAYEADIDNDGYQETVLHNDHLFAVFEGAGGRMTHLFVKGAGFDDTAIGVDNAYWADTDGDFNDVNHVAAFSEVSPNYQHDGYGISLGVAGTTATVELSRNEVTKTISLTEGDSFFDVVYQVGPATHWVQGGFSPSLVDLVWNGELDRVWAPDASYMGFRNPNTGMAAAWILGAGGAAHQKEISGTLMKGDEVKGSGVFQLQLFAGPTSAPDGSGDIAELRLLADDLADTIGPGIQAAAYYPATDRLRVTLDQPAGAVLPSSFSVYDGLAPLASVSLPPGTGLGETLPSQVLTFELDTATADLIEAMTGPDLYLVAGLGAADDENGNPSTAVTTLDNIVIEVVQTAIVIDGNVDPGEWSGAMALADSNDSAWTSANEIDQLLVKWDSEFLYLAIDGQVSGNSWLLYLDIDPGSGNGETDLTGTDAWERGASFSAPGFAADFQYGCYQHQSTFDGDGFWQLLTATTTQDRSGDIQSAFDSFHTFGGASGSELAIPWDALYGLGAGAVPVGAEVSLAASICWDPEPDGSLGGDSAPSNLGAALPVIDNVWTLTVDGNGDGLPDVGVSSVPSVPGTAARLLPNVPNPFNPSTVITFEIPGNGPAEVSLVVYDVRGNRISTLVRGAVEPGRHEVVWNGRTGTGMPVAAGTYFSQLTCRGQVVTRPLSLVK